MSLFILLCMIFCHIVDDFYLQGCLANMKQKKWWDKKIYSLKRITNTDYSHDYKVALAVHGFSWSFMVHLPLAVYSLVCVRPIDRYLYVMTAFIVIQGIIHALIDNRKANKLSINLAQDQLDHFLQIYTSWAFLGTIIP